MINFEIFTAASACIILFMIYHILRSKKDVTVVVMLPGLEPEHASTGNLNEMKACSGMYHFLSKYHKKFGPIFSYWHGSVRCVSTSSPELFQEQSTYFDRPVDLFEFLAPLISKDAIQFINGSDGRRRHATYAKCYSASSAKHYFNIFNKLGKQMSEQWMAFPKGDFILVQKETFEFAIKTILESTFGQEFENDAAVKNIKVNYDRCWIEMENGLNGDFMEPGSQRSNQFQMGKDALWTAVRTVLEHRKEMAHEERAKLPVDVVLGLGLTESEMVADLLTLFIAGFHTTALLLTWSIYFLAIHEEVQEKLRSEVLSLVGDTLEVSPETAAKLVYLRQVLNETLRVAAIGTMSARSHHSDMILGGYFIPAKMPVIHALGVSLHNEHIFHEPLKFDPERFTAENESVRLPFSFEPFGFAGNRKCPGYNFSYAEATVFLSHLIRSFKIKLSPDHQLIEPNYGFVTKPNNDIWIIVSAL